jgi:hypothetical protein
MSTEQRQQASGLLQPFHTAAADPTKGFFQALVGNGNPLTMQLQQLFGVEGHELANCLFSRQLFAFGDSTGGVQQAGFEAIANLHPQNVEQTMLAMQMAETFFLGEKLMRTAILDKDLAVCERRANLAAKLSRLFLDQSAAFARMQGRSTTQKIVVEKLNVEPGAQAAIGVLSTPGTRGRGGGSQ